MSLDEITQAGEELERILLDLLEALRVISFQLAVISTAQDEGDSPVFDDPEELRRYLSAI